ncbi:uncharacterized protein LOC120294914 [Eucalyptus grandis]|uniref:uncharacterized protein LOC120294914 n=1 Tax=Eucalyptus grandis TaxID=71139 RepID=UPI00192E9265|nr:uncharacterized protein LOC120294914 [Eucalyptus grandis]XP_039171855.1 uncharacterized protein LOC120294914 [Eucalyptus grandis]
MEESPSSSSFSFSTTPLHPLSYWDCLQLFLLRPALAISFVFSFILLGWVLAWKLVLVHVPLVQEIFGLRKKTVKPKPPTRHRLSKFYSSMDRDPQRSDSKKPN